jgi:hypothetical protein
MEIHTIGIDLGKAVFHLIGLNARGEVVVRKKCSRDQILRFAANLQVSLIGMEACEKNCASFGILAILQLGAGYESHSRIVSSPPPRFDSLLADNR